MPTSGMTGRIKCISSYIANWKQFGGIAAAFGVAGRCVIEVCLSEK